MLLIRLFSIVPLVLAACADARPQSNVSVPSGFYSYRELAQKLSSEGRLVVCSQSLRHRGALVCLKERTWDSSMRLLSSALGVEFHSESDSKSSWVMRADPLIAAREEQWRIKL